MADAKAVRPVKHTINLGDGVERKVVFTLNAMAELEEKYGSVEEAFKKIQSGSIAAIRFLLWCVLVPEGPEAMTERQIGALINLDNMNELMSTLMDMFEDSMPAAQALNEGVDPNSIAPAQANW